MPSRGCLAFGAIWALIFVFIQLMNISAIIGLHRAQTEPRLIMASLGLTIVITAVTVGAAVVLLMQIGVITRVGVEEVDE